MRLFIFTTTLLAAACAAKHSLLTAQRLIEAPRPGSGIASPVGHAALVGVSTYSFDSNVKSKVLYALHLPNASWSSTGEGYRPIQKPTPIVHNATSGIWLGPEEAAWIIDGTLYGKNLSAAAGVPDPKDHGFRIGAFPAAPQTMQVAGAGLDADRVQLVFSAQVYDDGDLAKVAEHDASEESQEWERVKVYDSTWVRHWDSWIRPTKRSQLFSVELRRDANGYKTSWTFSSPFRNLLKGTKLEAPTPPFGDEADYAVSIKAGLVAFTAKDPLVNPAWHTKQNIYVVPLDASSPPREVTSGKFGATSSPAFSPDSTHLAWLQMARDGFESDVRRVVIHHLASQRTSAILADWDRSPSAISWSADGKELYLTTEEHEQVKLFAIPLRTDKAGIFTDARKDDLTTLVHSGGLSAVDIIPGGGAVLTASNLTGPNDLYHMTPKGALTRLTAFGEWSAALGDVDFGPAPQRFNFSGAEGRESHGWIHRPPSYDSSLSYPLAVLIHGGPEGAWTNSWSLRWNPAVFAAAGFVTVTLDPAGSTGFGQKYQEGILRDWGGKAFYDIRAGVHHILDTFDNVDRERVVAAGASYGGFMINFIQGHNQDGLFKGLVSHDGVFSTLSTWYSTEELHFPEFQFGGVPWENRDAYLRFSPEQFTQNWATPQLTIAGGLDFRLPESEGLSVFNTLQRRGVPSRLVYFPKENHWVQSERNSKKWYDEVIGWLHKYSAPKEEQEPQGQAQQGQAGLTFQR